MGKKHEIRPYHLHVENFRNFRDVSFDLGKRLTVISGQNGVGKSNLLSLIASGSGLNKKSALGSNFQPEFYDFFNVDQDENFENYKLYLSYIEDDGDVALTKRLSFKDDSKTSRGIRIIPRTTNVNMDNCTLKEAENLAKEKYDVGGAARVKIPTIYLSLSRLYPLGERKELVTITEISKRNSFYQKKSDEKYKEWYNYVVPNSIKNEASLSLVEKNTCSRASLHMDIIDTPILSQSIGQDNIGNIISALVDLYLLSLEEDYRGAVLCIDEIDVSLHPDTQIRLLDLFDKLAGNFGIQFVVSTHSLTVLKEIIKKENQNNMNYKVVYIKNPSAPYVTESNSYELLEADMFGNLSFDRPKIRLYFEDCIGMELFRLLFKAFREIYNTIEKNIENPCLRNSSNVDGYKEINDRIHNLSKMLNIEDKVKQVPTILGCEELIKICKADTYFKRVIFILDGDARYKEPAQKPRIRDYLEKKYDQKQLQLNDRQHMDNLCFFPDYFAPESFLYAIIYKIYNSPLNHNSFWRALDMKEDTALYTADKIKGLFSDLADQFNNDDLKHKFKDVSNSEIWSFIQKSDIVTYYYSDYENVLELVYFIENFRKAYNMAWPIMISNRYS
ncbi:MAG: AAA family ATPase [Lachnospiraceae bacterium]